MTVRRRRFGVLTFSALTLATLTALVPSRSLAQLAQPGPTGVVMGHIHVVGRDLDAHRRFWAALGATPTSNGTLEMMQFPGAYVNLRQGEPTGGSVGSVIDHVGFNVKSVAEWLPKWQAAGLKMEPQTRPTQVYLIGPDEVRVEILEDATIATAITFHHVHYFVADPIAAQQYYAQTFGAIPGKRGNFDAADLPGVNLTFSKATGPLAKTQGRSIDHVGFEVRNLDAFLKNLKARGATIDREYQKSAAANLMLSYLTDPFGTYLELTEGLTPGTLR
jgi:catechol 2,3-dioxygenase-like lactoylglutathione lyase family enzyme